MKPKTATAGSVRRHLGRIVSEIKAVSCAAPLRWKLPPRTLVGARTAAALIRHFSAIRRGVLSVAALGAIALGRLTLFHISLFRGAQFIDSTLWRFITPQ